MPYEEAVYADVSIKDGDVYRLKRANNKLCVFLDDHNRCKVYPIRPLECRIYPWVLSYKKGGLDTELHSGCPQKELAHKPHLPEVAQSIPHEWLVNYERLKISK